MGAPLETAMTPDATNAGTPTGTPLLLLRLEGAATLLAATAGFAALGGSWWLYAALILAPDLAMLGYLGGPRAGAALYNAAHVTLGPLALGALAWALGSTVLGGIALVWLAHVGLDRMAGYGLKYASGFGATHLSVIGARGPATP